MKDFRFWLTAALVTGLLMIIPGCENTAAPLPPEESPAEEVDLLPPQFIRMTQPQANQVVIECDEPVDPEDSEVTLSGGLAPLTLEERPAGGLIINLEGTQTPGVRYDLEALLDDGKGNSLSLIASFYGWNGEIPELLINEVTTQGSGTHPDCVEILALEGGNLAGVTFFEGDSLDYDEVFVFPELILSAGDYVILHCKPQGIPEEQNENGDKSASGGLDASDKAWDFWIPEGSGLSGNNGVLTLYTNPGGDCLDALLYSNRTSASDENYRGFGSTRLMNQADRLDEGGHWAAGGERIAPEDGVNPDDSTATRSLCRTAQPADTNGAGDWHITPTSGSTFGEANTDEVYVP